MENKTQMTNTQKHAKRELDILAATVPNAIVTPFAKEILALCEAFGQSGQSGSSAPMTASAISHAVKSLMMFEPIAPITGEDSEWFNPDENTFQNNRCSAVFKKSKDGKPYYLDAIIWKGEEEWDTFTGRVYIDDKDFKLISSRQFIKIPFNPKRFYIDVVRVPITKEEAESKDMHYIEGNNECYYTILKDPKQLKEVFEYYEEN